MFNFLHKVTLHYIKVEDSCLLQYSEGFPVNIEKGKYWEKNNKITNILQKMV